MPGQLELTPAYLGFGKCPSSRTLPPPGSLSSRLSLFPAFARHSARFGVDLNILEAEKGVPVPHFLLSQSPQLFEFRMDTPLSPTRPPRHLSPLSPANGSSVFTLGSLAWRRPWGIPTESSQPEPPAPTTVCPRRMEQHPNPCPQSRVGKFTATQRHAFWRRNWYI